MSTGYVEMKGFKKAKVHTTEAFIQAALGMVWRAMAYVLLGT